ncbi:hypothetical protein [Paractinoplanes toevensis]|uniref:Uncharacterized protein n=1 Tax=Paractinoplanes toevensis TaxID=571911 RepID=A0A919T6K0_9ACTN|nr:hypothetical protein [Actinoplanes toevensis]GIM88795.1 hypothetical protein Ato02nite_005880 [Actinoplanes toevensis]
MLWVDEEAISYDSPDEVRQHITFLAEHDPETLADLARALLAELERQRSDA